MNQTVPPPKPQRRPAPSRPLSFATEDTVPGIPKTWERAREAARGSSPDLVEHRLGEVERDVSQLSRRTDTAVTEIKHAVSDLSERFGEFERSNSVSEVTKIQEEQKTKRFTAIVGVLTLVLTPLITVVTTVFTRDERPVAAPTHQMSANDIAIADCAKKPTEALQSDCVTKIVVANIVPAGH